MRIYPFAHTLKIKETYETCNDLSSHTKDS
jgi:hypothetical protein